MNTKEDLVNAILKSAYSNQHSDDKKKLRCADAFELAKQFKMEIIEIGHICDQQNIKICKCQLGCFT